jgi:putative Mg2+ transporter-C (MgtC) family protein
MWYFDTFQISLMMLWVLRLVISLILGAVVGLERELVHKPAGLRTHILVSMGACLVTIISIYEFQADPARVAAGIITGIGFLGAGSIIASGGHIQGVTTAASLWIVAAIGLAVGSGSYVLATIAAVMVFFVLRIKRVGPVKKTLKKIK